MNLRRAAAACLGLAVLMGIVVVRCGFRDDPPPPDAAVPPVADAPLADAPLDAPAVAPDAAVPPKKRVPKPATKPGQPATKPTPPPKPVPPPVTPPPVTSPVTPPPVTTPPATTPPGTRTCVHPPNPAGCPAKEPNVNRPCDAEGVHCLYGTSCCPFEYVCKDGAFEVWISTCP